MNLVRLGWRKKLLFLSFHGQTSSRKKEKYIYIYSGWREEGGRMESVDQEGNGRWKIRSRRCILMLLNDLSCKRSFHLCNISRVSNFFFFFFLIFPLLSSSAVFHSFLYFSRAHLLKTQLPTLCFLLRSLLFFSFRNRKSRGFFLFFFFNFSR